MTGVLKGLRVIDFGQYLAGPLTAVMLADHGADVIHIDPPGGPRWSSQEGLAADAFLNRGKRRILLDLKQPDDTAIANRLVASGDVVIENFRPGVMDRLGLGPETMTGRHPQLIYCSLPGFAADDSRAGLPGWEGLIAAATENCRLRCGEEPEGWDTSRPTYTAVPIASNFASYHAATAIVMALTSRQRTGRGQRIEVALFDAMFEAIGFTGTYITAKGLPPWRPITAYGSGTYRCRDGRYVQFTPHGASGRFVTWFAHAASVDDWAAEGLLDGLRLRDEPDLVKRLHDRLADLFLTRPAHEWEELANRIGVPLALIRTSAEWIGTEHARSSEAVVEIDDPVLGPTWMAGLPVHLSATPGSIRGPRHLPDADRDDILAELDQLPPRPATAIADEAPAPLTGMRVVDLTQVLAGPTAGRIMVEYGAEVVKVNMPHERPVAHALVNRGKQTILLDVESPQGQRVFWKLVEEADVIMQNFPLGTAERYGIGYEQVRVRRPDIVYISVSCHGYGGPWGARRGYEVQAQAVTGIMDRVGSDGRPAILGPYQPLDFATGVLAAFAGALAIFHRSVTGQGQHVQSSLSHAGTYQQAAYMLDYQGKIWDEPRGPQALGHGPLQRFYQAKDGWFFLGASPADLPRLGTVEGMAGVEILAGAEFEDALEKAFRVDLAANWVARLQRAGQGAHAIVKLADLMSADSIRARSLSILQLTAEAGEVTMPGLAVRMSVTPPRVGEPVHQPGAVAAAVLRRIGLGDAILELERAWALQVSNLPSTW